MQGTLVGRVDREVQGTLVSRVDREVQGTLVGRVDSEVQGTLVSRVDSEVQGTLVGRVDSETRRPACSSPGLRPSGPTPLVTPHAHHRDCAKASVGPPCLSSTQLPQGPG